MSEVLRRRCAPSGVLDDRIRREDDVLGRISHSKLSTAVICPTLELFPYLFVEFYLNNFIKLVPQQSKQTQYKPNQWQF